jgi:hypothetical protein
VVTTTQLMQLHQHPLMKLVLLMQPMQSLGNATCDFYVSTHAGSHRKYPVSPPSLLPPSRHSPLSSIQLPSFIDAHNMT